LARNLSRGAEEVLGLLVLHVLGHALVGPGDLLRGKKRRLVQRPQELLDQPPPPLGEDVFCYGIIGACELLNEALALLHDPEGLFLERRVVLVVRLAAQGEAAQLAQLCLKLGLQPLLALLLAFLIRKVLIFFCHDLRSSVE
jgi:hypothetical protein